MDARLDATRSEVVLEGEPEEPATTTIYVVRVLGNVRLFAIEGRPSELPPADAMLMLLAAIAEDEDA